MKKITLAILFLSLSFIVFTACKKSFFETQSEDGSLNSGSAFQQKADFEAFLIGAYATIASGEAGGEAWLKAPGFASQDWVIKDERPIPMATYMDPGHNDFKLYWTGLYKIIGNTNILLEKLESAASILTAEEIASMRAQAKFLRGFSYFMLARAFGDVPMPLTSYNSELNSIGCTAQMDVFKQAIIDLSEAADGLPEEGTWGAAQRGRASKGAALAYLTNAYMYTKEWDKALTVANTLQALSNPKYALAPSVRTSFSIKQKNTAAYKAENIFEVTYRSDGDYNWSAAIQGGSLMAALVAPREVGEKWAVAGGWSEFLINRKAVDAYDPSDERRKELIKIYPEEYLGESMATTFTKDNGWSPKSAAFPNGKPFLSQTAGYSAKYWLGPTPTTTGLLSSQNIPLMRYSEFLLNLSEILFMKGDPGGAYTNLNLVRARANLAPKTVSSSATTFMTDLMNERRFELLFEPNLWFHYTRTGTAAAFISGVHNTPWQEKWKLFPIPFSERLANPNLCSNGY